MVGRSQQPNRSQLELSNRKQRNTDHTKEFDWLRAVDCKIVQLMFTTGFPLLPSPSSLLPRARPVESR